MLGGAEGAGGGRCNARPNRSRKKHANSSPVSSEDDDVLSVCTRRPLCNLSARLPCKRSRFLFMPIISRVNRGGRKDASLPLVLLHVTGLSGPGSPFRLPRVSSSPANVAPRSGSAHIVVPTAAPAIACFTRGCSCVRSVCFTLWLFRERVNAVGLENVITAQDPNEMPGIVTRNDR